MVLVDRVDAVIKKCLLFIVAVCGPVVAQEPLDAANDYWRQAVLYRDEWGVPHIYADNTRAMAFAFGYAQAEDHIEPMLLAYRMANGRAAEVLGEALAASDELAIRLAHSDLAYAAYERTDSVTRDLCEGFAQGVNAWLLEHPREAPAWAEGVHPADVLALLHRFLLSMAPFDYPEAPHLLPGMPSANAWAVAPSMSKSGEAMLVINPHTRYDGAFQWYEAHLATRNLNVYGGTLFGLPVILMGHNQDLGWALSPNEADIADIYVEVPPTPRQRNPKSMMPGRNVGVYQGVRYAVNEYRSYYVKTDSGFEERSVSLQRTAHGPVVAYAEGRPLSWCAGGYFDFGGIRQLFDMGLAKDLNQFRGALDRQQLSSFHTVYADRSGNIWYQYNARVGQKRSAVGAPGSPAEYAYSVYDFPLSTVSGLFEWGNLVRPDALPWFLNPEAGYLQACGTPPWLVTAYSGTSAANWPNWLVRNNDSYRAKRVRRLFSMGPRSFGDIQAMLFDTVVPLAADAVPFVLRAADRNPEWLARAHPDLLVGLDMLREWNYLGSVDSMAMTFFHVWWSVLQLDAGGGVVPDEALHARIQENAPWFQNHALESAAEAAKLFRNEFQTMSVPWGEVHTLRRGRREVPLAGSYSGGPIFAHADRTYEGKKWRVDEGYGFAMAVRFGNTPKAVSLVPFGSSEVSTSPHYSDQLDLLVQQRFKVAHFEREEVERRAVSAMGKSILLRAPDNEASVYIEAAEPVLARLAVSNYLNASLPSAMVAFTHFIEPIVTPERVSITAVIELAVGPQACAYENLDKLAVYGYHPVVGWAYVPEQALDYERRTFTARVYESQVYAILGAESLQINRPEEPVGRLARRRGDDEGAALGPAVDAGRIRGKTSGMLGREVTKVARNDDAFVVDLSAEDRVRVSKLLPAKPLIPQGGRQAAWQETGSQPNAGGLRPILPAVPPGWEPQRDWPLPVPRASSPGFSGSPGLFSPRPRDYLAPETYRSSEETWIEPAGDLTAARAAGLEIEKEAPPESVSEAVLVETPEEHGVAPVRPGDSTEGPSGAARPSRVAWSSQKLSDIIGATSVAPGTKTFELAPDPTRASPMRIGKNLELRPPFAGTVFRVSAEKSIRAQVILREVPPEPFPGGLAGFSPVFEVLYSPLQALGTTALTIAVPPGLCSQERFSELKLYAYDRQDGWTPMYRHKSNLESRTFSALDPAFRIYAVLGPADALQDVARR